MEPQAQQEIDDLIRLVVVDLAQSGSSPRMKDVEALFDEPLPPPLRARAANLVAHHYFQQARYTDALRACQNWVAVAPGEHAAQDSLLSILVRLRRYDEVIARAVERLDREPTNFALRGTLANALSKVGRAEEAREQGEACLSLKDASASGSRFSLAGIQVPAFDAHRRKRNVISFSLYGNSEKYRLGAIRNIVAARHLYPEWVCRFYVDTSIDRAFQDRMIGEGATVIAVDGLPCARFGTFWRFLVVDDVEVDRYLVRDCDACVNLRERAAVDDWIASDRHFHVMRDGLTHCDVMLAGMWGGTRAALPPMLQAIIDFCQESPLSRTADQAFLRNCVWPTVKQSVLAHDSKFNFGGAVDFPRRAAIPGLVVGQATRWLAEKVRP